MTLRRWPVILATGTMVAGAVVALGAAVSASAPSSAEALSVTRSSAQLTAPPVTLTPAPTTNATNVPTGPATLTVKVSGVALWCFEPAAILYVTQNNIHIRQLPNGANVASINRRAWFDSGWTANGKGPYHCMTKNYIAGTLWVYGFSNHNHNLVGFVGFNWLNFRSYYK